MSFVVIGKLGNENWFLKKSARLCVGIFENLRETLQHFKRQTLNFKQFNKSTIQQINDSTIQQ